MEFILILALIHDRAPSQQAILFPTEAACEAAKDKAAVAFGDGKGWHANARYDLKNFVKGVCVPLDVRREAVAP